MSTIMLRQMTCYKWRVASDNAVAPRGTARMESGVIDIPPMSLPEYPAGRAAHTAALCTASPPPTVVMANHRTSAADCLQRGRIHAVKRMCFADQVDRASSEPGFQSFGLRGSTVFLRFAKPRIEPYCRPRGAPSANCPSGADGGGLMLYSPELSGAHGVIVAECLIV